MPHNFFLPGRLEITALNFTIANKIFIKFLLHTASFINFFLQKKQGIFYQLDSQKFFRHAGPDPASCLLPACRGQVLLKTLDSCLGSVIPDAIRNRGRLQPE